MMTNGLCRCAPACAAQERWEHDRSLEGLEGSVSAAIQQENRR